MAEENTFNHAKLELDNVPKIIEEYPKASWQKQSYRPKDALVYKRESGIAIALYVGQTYDPSQAELKKAYWDHDYCETCGLILYESDNPKHGTGYSDGSFWICSECFES